MTKVNINGFIPERIWLLHWCLLCCLPSLRVPCRNRIVHDGLGIKNVFRRCSCWLRLRCLHFLLLVQKFITYFRYFLSFPAVLLLDLLHHGGRGKAAAVLVQTAHHGGRDSAALVYSDQLLHLRRRSRAAAAPVVRTVLVVLAVLAVGTILSAGMLFVIQSGQNSITQIPNIASAKLAT